MKYFFLGSTPIGNLKDLSYNMVFFLYYADILLVESKIRIINLLRYVGINAEYKRIIVIKNNIAQKLSNIILSFINKKVIVILSTDAGTPIINDPGNAYVNDIRIQGCKIGHIPGISSLISAITSSGLICNRFLFMGFFPQNKYKQTRMLQYAFLCNLTLIIYESPVRINHTINIILRYYGITRVAIMRELTKRYETQHFGILGMFIYPKIFYKGEYIIIIEHPRFINPKIY
jgi:16S rRNA (cytidine1402-2'-O)-methyltransferase